MRRPKLLLIILLLLPVCLKAQLINGKVYRIGTDSLIGRASVYYGGTITGTSTSKQGTFALPVIPGNTPIVVSCVGYYSTTISIYNQHEQLIVYLKPKVHELKAVNIRLNNTMSRADMERMFIREFLGVTENALSCHIANMDDIELDYSKKTGTLAASCDNPIEIDNKRLGYHITYYLDKFVKTSKNTVYQGNYIFKDIAAPADLKKITRNREDTYDGSRMEFIRALWSNTLNQHSYAVYTSAMRELKYDSLVVTNKAGLKFINSKYRLVVLHHQAGNLASQLDEARDSCYIDQNGFHDTGLLWLGYMGRKRIGDMLPYQFVSVKDKPEASDDPETLLLLQEQKKHADSNVVRSASAYKPPKFPKDIQLFKNIVLSPNNLLDPQLIVRKWQRPVYYKIYGSYGRWAVNRVDSLFNQLSRLTGLKIAKTQTDSLVNFYLVFDDIGKAQSALPREALTYFASANKTSGSYYFAGDDGFTTSVQLVKPPVGVGTWAAIQKQIINGMGFFGFADGYFKSMFYDIANDTPLKIQPHDAGIIKLLYNPAIRSGMTEQQLDEVLTQLSIQKLQ